MSARILVLTAGFGEGHNAAARAIVAAANAAYGENTAQLVDAFALASPRFNTLARKSYLGMINRAPGLWSAMYGWLDRSPHAGRLMGLLIGERRALARKLKEDQPALLCSTYPVYGFMLDALAKQGLALPPHFNVVTDSISINSLWWRARCDGWFLPNEDSAGILRQAGLPERSLHVLGFPVHPHFAALAPTLSPPDLATGATPRVLYIVNSGTATAAETARRLLTTTDWDLTCTVGRNEALRVELSRLAQARRAPARILGWTDEIPALLLTHNVVISKAGGATTQEALAARCPMVVNQIVPGQEEGNYELLRRHRIGALAETPDAVIRELQLAFQNRGEVWQAWRRAVDSLSRPQAARDIAAALFARLPAEEPIPLPLRAAAELTSSPSTAPA
ncbi:MAG: galactosyldiacylglycerol synthase [Verrucomicrobiota bacterium]